MRNSYQDTYTDCNSFDWKLARHFLGNLLGRFLGIKHDQNGIAGPVVLGNSGTSGIAASTNLGSAEETASIAA